MTESLAAHQIQEQLIEPPPVRGERLVELRELREVPGAGLTPHGILVHALDRAALELAGSDELLRESELWALDALEDYNKLLKPIFGDTVYFARTEKLPELGFNPEFVKGLIYSPFEGQIHSGKMMKSLIRLQVAARARTRV